MINILIFIDDLNDGGAQKVFALLATELAELDAAVTLVTLNEGVMLDKISKNVNVVVLKSKKVSKSFFELKGVVSKIKPDVVLTGLLHNNIFLILFKFIFGFKFSLVISEHSIPSKIPFNNLSFTNKVCTYLRPFLYNLANKIISVSDCCKEDLIDNYNISKNKVATIYNPIELACDINISLEDKQYFQYDDLPYFISVGRLHHSKNFSYLINAFSKTNKVRDTRLIILGEGPERLPLEELITLNNLNDRVILLGYTKNPYKYMKKSKALIISSHYEGFGNVAVEALSCGVPVITTNCFGPTEIINSNSIGAIVKNGNEDDLISVINDFKSGDFDQVAMLTRASCFSKDKIAKQYLKELKNCLD